MSRFHWGRMSVALRPAARKGYFKIMRNRSYWIFLVTILSAISAGLGVSGCNGKGAPRVSAAVAPSAEVALVTRGSVSHTLSLAGQFEPYQEVDVHAKVSGYVRHIYVDIGDKVHAGQTLAVLEVPELKAQLLGTTSEVAHSQDEIKRARNDVARAQANHFALHSDYDRLKKAAAAQPGLIAQQELDDAKAKDQAAEAQVDAAKSALAAARQQSATASANNQRVQDMEAYTRVTAPFSGIVTWRYADTGALIQAGTSSATQSLPLVKLAQSNLLRLRLPVPEGAVPFIHEGAKVQVNVDAVHRSFTGTVARFTHNVSLDTRTMETEVDVPNQDLSLTPGMYAKTTLQLEHRENVLTIPVGAVIQDGGQTTVLALDGQDRVRMVPVKLGLQGSNLVQVVSGLSEGERVILGGQSKYQANEQVRPVLESIGNLDMKQQQEGQ